MRVFRLIICGLLILLLNVSTLLSRSMNGGFGLTYLKSAWALKPGYLTLTNKIRFFGKVASPLQGSAVTYWDVQGAFSLNYGINEHYEVALNPIMYQDNHKGGKGFNLPDDIFLSVKAGSFRVNGSPFVFGGIFEARFPTAKYHNIMFEPYSAGKVSVAFIGLATYSKDPLYPDDNLNIHLNLGYINHNDVGQKLIESDIDTISVNNITQEFIYGLGVKIPTIDFDFLLELHGSVFIQNPPKNLAYSCENYLYLTPGITFRSTRWLSLSFSTDLRLSADSDESIYGFLSKPTNVPNYPAWRINLGAKITLLPTSVYKVREKDILIKKAESRRELFEQIIKEQRETESAEEELDRIKNERRKAERELERLRRILEGGSKSKKDKKEDN